MTVGPGARAPAAARWPRSRPPTCPTRCAAPPAPAGARATSAWIAVHWSSRRRRSRPGQRGEHGLGLPTQILFSRRHAAHGAPAVRQSGARTGIPGPTPAPGHRCEREGAGFGHRFARKPPPSPPAAVHAGARGCADARAGPALAPRSRRRGGRRRRGPAHAQARGAGTHRARRVRRPGRSAAAPPRGSAPDAGGGGRAADRVRCRRQPPVRRRAARAARLEHPAHPRARDAAPPLRRAANGEAVPPHGPARARRGRDGRRGGGHGRRAHPRRRGAHRRLRGGRRRARRGAHRRLVTSAALTATLDRMAGWPGAPGREGRSSSPTRGP